MALSRADAFRVARRATQLTCDAIEDELCRRDVLEKDMQDQLEGLERRKKEFERRVEESNTHIMRLEEDNRQLGHKLGELPIQLDAARKDATSEMNESLKKARQALFRHINPVLLYCRVRPKLPAQGSANKAPSQSISKWKWNDFSIINGAGEAYSFWRVFGPHCPTANVFDELEPMIQTALHGQHIVLITYGETQSGKTHTTIEPNAADPSLLDRFAALAFPQYQIHVSFVEVCCNMPHDLLRREEGKLVVGNSESSRADVFLYSNTGLYFRYQGKGGGYMTPTVCDSTEELKKLRNESIRRRAKHHDKPTSSRGPSWLELRVHDRNDGTLRGILTIVDLMGAEDSANQLGKHKKESETGRTVNYKVSEYLKSLRDQHRVARPSTLPDRTPTRRSNAHREHPDNFMRILIPSFEGQILDSPDLPRVAVLAHIYEAAEHEKQNQTTMDVMEEWRTNLLDEKSRNGTQEACNECEAKDRENALLKQQMYELEVERESCSELEDVPRDVKEEKSLRERFAEQAK
ncbi:hypothetical protein J4E80_010641 [Alternaria sp. BMP 0032]|nr:hypothetical protein J4E80_010641 [Alternaria sp. BMP 0032]